MRFSWFFLLFVAVIVWADDPTQPPSSGDGAGGGAPAVPAGGGGPDPAPVAPAGPSGGGTPVDPAAGGSGNPPPPVGTTDTEAPTTPTTTTTEEPTTTTTTEPPPPPPPPGEVLGDKFKFEDSELDDLKPDSPGHSRIALIHRISSSESFRIRLGTSDECSRIIVCAGNIDVAERNETAKPRYNHTNFCEDGQIVFDQKEKLVNMPDGKQFPFASSVADFIAKGSDLQLKVYGKLQSSNTFEKTAKTDMKSLGWKKFSDLLVVTSGVDCPNVVHTFRRGSPSAYYFTDLNKWHVADNKYSAGNNDAIPAKTKILPMHGGIGKTFKEVAKSEYTEQCRRSYMGEGGVTKMGDMINIPHSVIKSFKYTLDMDPAMEKNKLRNKLQLELKEPATCEWVRLCFAGNCEEAKTVLDLVFRHRFYVAPDNDKGRIFDTPINELDTIVFDFDKAKRKMTMETRPVAHGEPLKTEIGLDWQPKGSLVLTASNCEFRLTRADPERVRENSFHTGDEYARFNGFIKDCVEIQ